MDLLAGYLDSKYVLILHGGSSQGLPGDGHGGDGSHFKSLQRSTRQTGYSHNVLLYTEYAQRRAKHDYYSGLVFLVLLLEHADSD